MARYELREKFWAPTIKGATLFIQFGKLGHAGQTRLKKFATSALAKQAMAASVAEKLADGYVVADGKAAAALPAAKRTAMLAIARELGGAAVEREVAMAIDTPVAYLAKFAETYETLEDSPHSEVPWLGMIECLNERDKLAEVDWKELGSEVLAWLERVGGAPAKRALKAAHEPELDERRTYEAIALFGRLLGGSKLALISLEKNSDSYALGIVAAGRLAPLQKLARSAGVVIVHHDGKELEKLEKERGRHQAKFTSMNPWVEICAEHDHERTATAVDSVLWGLLHDDPKIDRVREVMSFAPKRDHALIAMTLAIYDGSASKLAKTTKEPALLLTALRYLEADAADRRYERLAASAILAERLKIKPDRGKLHVAICDACNLWDYDKVSDAQLARLPAASRDRLARFGDAMLVRAHEGDERWEMAHRMLSLCGDATSLPLIAAAGERAMKARAEMDYDMSGPFAWQETAKHIKRRLR